MTQLDVVYRYRTPAGKKETRAIDSIREVYGVRRIQFNEKEHTVKVEFDASRLSEETIASLLRRAGLDILEKLTLA